MSGECKDGAEPYEPDEMVRIDELGGLGRSAWIPKWVYELLTTQARIEKVIAMDRVLRTAEKIQQRADDAIGHGMDDPLPLAPDPLTSPAPDMPASLRVPFVVIEGRDPQETHEVPSRFLAAGILAEAVVDLEKHNAEGHPKFKDKRCPVILSGGVPCPDGVLLHGIVLQCLKNYMAFRL